MGAAELVEERSLAPVLAGEMQCGPWQVIHHLRAFPQETRRAPSGTSIST